VQQLMPQRLQQEEQQVEAQVGEVLAEALGQIHQVREEEEDGKNTKKHS
jgi:hypothetical protein